MIKNSRWTNDVKKRWTNDVKKRWNAVQQQQALGSPRSESTESYEQNLIVILQAPTHLFLIFIFIFFTH